MYEVNATESRYTKNSLFRYLTRRQTLRQITGADGNGILISLKVRFLRRNNNFNLEFDRACVRSFYDGATFHKVLNDARPKIPIYARNGGYLLKLFKTLLHRKNFGDKPCLIPSEKYNCAAKNEILGKLRYRSHWHRQIPGICKSWVNLAPL